MAMDANVQNLEYMAKAADAFKMPQAAIVQPVEVDYKAKAQESLTDMLAKKGLKLVNGLMGAFAGDAYAGGPEYETVDDILKDTPFKKTTLETYNDDIKHGKVVLFYYDNESTNKPSGRQAKIFKMHSNKYKNITFLCLEYDESLGHSKYSELGLESTPTYIFFVNGKPVFSHDKGPANEAELIESARIMEKNLSELNDM